ncbi:hypothetical protein PUNSTDRAFT_143613 [Punctularia strigosozonata HHB-11173 SS5]|uniref:uncharacterized protein n=1 Tax=Punctularia strigosozonata (strain HHB-11173) TaxID=741275 RepID=UPI00044180B7|nr:uncharacterized protein PUNSTDRAFT_143613 [Punctularia strigosozonata HHB-11173 SS5]EIN08946.1 hypothetical protein PUNSTDRAFT_143613 [Punctularia strigosozonata HHB-11173 SS5]
MLPTDAQRWYRDSFITFGLKHRKAMTRLPEWMTDEFLREDDCPLFHYGVGVTIQQLRVFCIKQQIYKPDKDSDEMAMCALPEIVDVLSQLCRAKLSWVRIGHPRYVLAIALYTNFNLYKQKRSRSQEATIFEAVKKELDLSPNAQPLWYWDMERSTRAETIAKMTKIPKIPKAVMLHKAVLGYEDIDVTADFEPSDEELKAHFGDLDEESDTDEESGSDSDSDVIYDSDTDDESDTNTARA